MAQRKTKTLMVGESKAHFPQVAQRRGLLAGCEDAGELNSIAHVRKTARRTAGASPWRSVGPCAIQTNREPVSRPRMFTATTRRRGENRRIATLTRLCEGWPAGGCFPPVVRTRRAREVGDFFLQFRSLVRRKTGRLGAGLQKFTAKARQLILQAATFALRGPDWFSCN